MILKMFTIHDSAAQAFLPPFFYPQDDQARRTFSQCVNDTTHQFGRHPHDYTLFCVGEFDDQTATIHHDTPVAIGNGVEFVQRKNDTDQPDLQGIA